MSDSQLLALIVAIVAVGFGNVGVLILIGIRLAASIDNISIQVTAVPQPTDQETRP